MRRPCTVSYKIDRTAEVGEELASPSNRNVPVHRHRKPPPGIEIRQTLLGTAIVKFLRAIPAVKHVGQVFDQAKDATPNKPNPIAFS
jgi:hypothetical protein